MKKRFLSLALAVLMIAAILPILPVAAEAEQLPPTLPGEFITDWGSGGSTPGNNAVENLGMDASTIGKSYTLRDFVTFTGDAVHHQASGKKETGTTGVTLNATDLSGACGVLVKVDGSANDAGLGMQFIITVNKTVNGYTQSLNYSTGNNGLNTTYVYNTSQLASHGAWAGEVDENGKPRVGGNFRIPGKGFSGYLYIPLSSFFYYSEVLIDDLGDAIDDVTNLPAGYTGSLTVTKFTCQAAGWTSKDSYADISSIRLVYADNLLTSVQPVLTDNIDFLVEARVSGDAELRVGINGINDENTVVLSPVSTVNGVATFRYEGLLPQQMNDDIWMDLWVDGERTDRKIFTMEEYCMRQLNKAGNSDALNTLLVDLLNYGAETQRYADYDASFPVGERLTAAQKAWASADLTASDLTSVRAVSGSGSEIVWKAASLTLRSTLALNVKFTSELSGLTVKVNGTAAEVTEKEGNYTAVYSGIYSGDFGETLTVTVWNEGVQVGKTLTYSVESYAKMALTNDDFADVRPLVNALCKYGRSAEAYGELNGEIRIPAFGVSGYLTPGHDDFDYNAGNGDWQKTVRNTTATAVNAYCAKLADEGYILKASNVIGNNVFRTYRSANGMETVHVNWFPTIDDGVWDVGGATSPSTGVCNIIACPGDEFIPSAEETAYAHKTLTTLVQPSRKAVDVYDDGNQAVAVGLSLVFQLADGRYIIVDGGPLQNDAAGDEDTLYQYLVAHAPAGEKPTIALWIGTHPHGDHIWLVAPFLQKYHDQVNLEMVGMNCPDPAEYRKYATDTDDMYYFTRFLKVAQRYYPDVIYWKMHTGDALRLADALIEVVFTHEDLTSVYGLYANLGINESDPNRNDSGREHVKVANELSTCFRLTIRDKVVLCMGDSEVNATLPFFNSYNGTDALKADIFQIPHHASWGDNYLDKNCCLYHLIDPKIAVYSVGTKAFLKASLMYQTRSNKDANQFLLGTLTDGVSWSMDQYWHRGEESGLRQAYTGGYKGTDVFRFVFSTHAEERIQTPEDDLLH